MYKIEDEPSIPVSVRLTAKGFTNLVLRPDIPASFGGYALVLDLNGHERRLITSVIRTFRAEDRRVPGKDRGKIDPDGHRLHTHRCAGLCAKNGNA